MDRPVSRATAVNLPNAISLARLCAVPVAVWLVLISDLQAAFWLFLAASLSDAIDGFLARRGARTRLGAILDPLADKLLLTSMYVVLAAVRLLPEWIAILVVFRDLLIVGGVLLFTFLGDWVAIAPIPVSKLNTALQLALVSLTLLLAAFHLHQPRGFIALVWCVAATTFISGASYVRRATTITRDV